MSNSPADVAGDMLVTGLVVKLPGVGVTQADWILKVGKVTSEPDRVVVMYDTPGRSPNPKWAVDFPSIQALVRGKPNDYGATWIKAREVRDKLLGVDSVDVGSDRWVSITCPGDVGFIGYDDSERPRFTVNFSLIIEPSAIGNREAL